MQKSYQVLKKAIKKIGVKKVATEMNLSASLIYKWCQCQESATPWMPSGVNNPLDRLRRIYELTRDPDLINWMCTVADGYYVPNTDSSHTKVDFRVINNIHHFIKEFSETLDAISQSYNDDRRISRREAVAIRKEWEDLKGIGEAFVRACESGKFDRKTK